MVHLLKHRMGRAKGRAQMLESFSKRLVSPSRATCSPEAWCHPGGSLCNSQSHFTHSSTPVPAPLAMCAHTAPPPTETGALGLQDSTEENHEMSSRKSQTLDSQRAVLCFNCSCDEELSPLPVARLGPASITQLKAVHEDQEHWLLRALCCRELLFVSEAKP